MSRTVKNQNRIVKKKRKARDRTGASPGEKENTASILEIPRAVSPQERSPSFAEGSPDSGKSGELGVQQGRIDVSESSVKPEALPGTPAEEEAAAPPAHAGEKTELLGFLMNHEEYAIPISQVKEIIRPAEMTVIPGSSAILQGIISLRGVIIPVFTLRNKLAQLKVSEESAKAPEEYEGLKRIIIIQIEQGYFGLMVDGVTDVIKINREEIQAPPSLLNQMGQEMIKGITRFKNRLVILLFIARIVEAIQAEIKTIRKT